MTPSEQIETLHIQFTQFPQNLLIPSIENVISFQAINYYNRQELFKFTIEGENLNVITPESFEKEVVFLPGETKDFDIKLVPVIDGYGKFVINIDWLKKVEYKVKVKKVRATVQKSNLNKILQKYLLPLTMESGEFNSNEYFISTSSKELKNAEKQLEELKRKHEEFVSLKKDWEVKNQQGIIEPEPTQQVSLEQIDNKVLQIAKAYLSNNDLKKALNFIGTISNEAEREAIYNNFIRAYAIKDLNSSIEIIKTLPPIKNKEILIRNIALDQTKIDPEQAPRVSYLLENPILRENLIIDIIKNIINSHTDIAIKMCPLIEKELMRIKVLLNIIKIVLDKKDKSGALEIFKSIINMAEKSSKLNLSEKDFKNEAYSAYKDCIHILAELDSPGAADSVLITFSLREVKDKVSEELFDIIYEMVDEMRTKFEPSPIFNQLYLFNTYTSKITEEMKMFCKMGGNMSHNILNKDFAFHLFFISLFGYDFSIFPYLDNLFNDLKFNNDKSIAYCIYPLKEYHDDTEFKVFSNLISQFRFTENLMQYKHPILIINLDFIPYIGKPTLILSSNNDYNQILFSKISQTFGNKLLIKIDESLFEGGKIEESLIHIFAINNCKIVNLILSYEFINNYKLFKDLVLLLLKT